MVRPRREGFGEEAKGDASDRFDRHQESDDSDESTEIDGSEPSGDPIDVRNSGGLSGALPERIRDVIRDGADANLLLGREEVENGILQWLRALDLQVIGGCRADERLKPLLKLSASSGAAEDQFIAQLLQHFEASEVAVLARCLCLPLVSVRVGKINKQGNMLYPTASRGFLSLTLLPSSHMRISFTGDDGCIERLALVSNDLESSSVVIENTSADTSGRSFLLKLPGSRILYFWCSEKSKADGMELLVKMKDLLSRKPSLACLTGISKSRLDSFATHLRVYILASSSTPTGASTSSSGLLMATSDFHSSSEADLRGQSRSFHARFPATHVAKVHPVHQGSLSPRSNAFKDGTLRNLFSSTNGVREKVRRRAGESSTNIQPSTAALLHDQSTSQREGRDVEKHESRGLVIPGLSSLSSPLFSLSPTFTIPSQTSDQSSFFSPYYCWCPPFPTSMQFNTTSHMPTASDLMPLPPLSTFLSPAAPPESLITSKYLLNVTDFPPLKLPSLLPDPLVRLSMPIPSICPLPSSQQIATFVPFMSDSIVHIPVIDFCSSGQGYLVSAGTSMSAAIPSLPIISHAGHQLLPPSESPVEKNARETLRLLMASTPTFTPPKLFNVLPEVLSSMELCGNGRLMPGNDLFEVAAADVVSTPAGDTSDEEDFSEEMEECNCPNINNCRMLNHEPDEI